MQNDSTLRTVTVAAILCVVCSVLVSSAAVMLRDRQEANKQLDIRKNLLLSAGMIEADKEITPDEINEAFALIDTRIIDLETGKYVDMKPEDFDARTAEKDPKTNYKIPSQKDLGGIKVRAKYSEVYIGKNDNGEVAFVALPVHGKGLWSTLYGFLCLESDTKTVKGFGFYKHGETPGLGGEIDNPRWKASWVGKTVLGKNYDPVIDVLKGSVNPASSKANQQIDGLSGATITANGVEGLVNYWVGENGFGPFLANFRKGEL